MDVRKGMNVKKEAVHLGRSGMDILKAGEEETQCGGSVSGDESPSQLQALDSTWKRRDRKGVHRIE